MVWKAPRECTSLEVPATQATERERHLYHEFFIVVEGRGATETWREGAHAFRHSFEWQPGWMFRIAPNSHYRLINATRERALLIAANNAPGMFNMFRDRDFIFARELLPRHRSLRLAAR